MSYYVAGSFADLYETDLGSRLWQFLTEGDNFIRMETASYLSRPALEPVQPFLIQKFGSEVLNDKNNRLKQMMGHMVRQIMEHHGYKLDQTDQKLRNNDLFSRASRYTKL